MELGLIPTDEWLQLMRCFWIKTVRQTWLWMNIYMVMVMIQHRINGVKITKIYSTMRRGWNSNFQIESSRLLNLSFRFHKVLVLKNCTILTIKLSPFMFWEITRSTCIMSFIQIHGYNQYITLKHIWNSNLMNFNRVFTQFSPCVLYM